MVDSMNNAESEGPDSIASCGQQCPLVSPVMALSHSLQDGQTMDLTSAGCGDVAALQLSPRLSPR